MNWKAHLTGGFVLSFLFLFLNWKYSLITIQGSWTFYILIIAIIMFYSLAPDLDHQMGKLRLFVTLLGLILIIYFTLTNDLTKVIISSIILLILWILPLFGGFGHRGHYHSLLFGLILAIPLVLIGWPLALIGLIAFFSHLLLDCCIKVW